MRERSQLGHGYFSGQTCICDCHRLLTVNVSSLSHLLFWINANTGRESCFAGSDKWRTLAIRYYIPIWATNFMIILYNVVRNCYSLESPSTASMVKEIYLQNNIHSWLTQIFIVYMQFQILQMLFTVIFVIDERTGVLSVKWLNIATLNLAVSRKKPYTRHLQQAKTNIACAELCCPPKAFFIQILHHETNSLHRLIRLLVANVRKKPFFAARPKYVGRTSKCVYYVNFTSVAITNLCTLFLFYCVLKYHLKI